MVRRMVLHRTAPVSILLASIVSAAASWRARLFQASVRRWRSARPCRATAPSSSSLPRSQASAGSAKMVRPTAKPLTMRIALPPLWNAWSSASSLRFEAEQHHAAQHGSRAADHRRRSCCQAMRVACGSSFHQSGLMPSVVEPAQHASRSSSSSSGAMLAGDDLDQQLAARPSARRRSSVSSRRSCSALQRVRIVRDDRSTGT